MSDWSVREKTVAAARELPFLEASWCSRCIGRMDGRCENCRSKVVFYTPSHFESDGGR